MLMGCQSTPTWLAKAPLIGSRWQDDVGQSGYVPQPPRRVAILSAEAQGLWKAAALPNVTLYGCIGTREDDQRFYLPCSDPIALIDALHRAQVEWIWADPRFVWPESLRLPAPVFYFQPKSTQDWLHRLRLLGEVYDVEGLRSSADSLLRIVDTLSARLQAERRFRVLLVGGRDSLEIYTDRHPLGQMAFAAGSQPPTASTPILSAVAFRQQTFQPDILIVPAEKTHLVNALLLEVPDLYSSPAILHRRLFTMPRSLMEAPLSQPLESFYLLGRIFHPELMGSEVTPIEKSPNQPE